MALRVKDITTIAQKFVARAGVAGQDYTNGVKAAGTTQFDNAIAAKDSWSQGVQLAVQNNSFVNGLNKAGPQKWVTNATSKGSKNYGPGVAAAQSAYVAGFTPYLNTLANLSLPPRYPRGDPRNAARSQAVGQALNKQRTGQA